MTHVLLSTALVAALMLAALGWMAALRATRAAAAVSARAAPELAALERRVNELAGERIALQKRCEQLATESAQAAAAAAAQLATARAELAAMAGTATGLQEERDRLRADQRELSARVHQLAADNAALKSQVAAAAGQLAEQKAWFEQQTHHLRTEIEGTTSRLFEEKTRSFNALSAQRLGELLGPLHHQISEFKQRVEQTYSQDLQDRTALKTQIDALQSLNRSISEQAQNLTNALTRSGKVQGDWGEFVLRRLFEESGLEEGREYALQYHVAAAADDREAQRPDAVVFMPENRQLVIDSKVSLTAWTECCSAADDAARQAAMRAHLVSLRNHIRALSSQDYQRSPDLHSIDFVVMFVPVEAALLEALKADADLYSEAFKRRIVLVTPTTLFAVIKMVEGLWSTRKREENAERIAEAGRKLYEKLCTFLETFDDASRAMSRATEKMAAARKQLASGNGNALKLANQMRAMGVVTAKQLPEPESEASDDVLEPTAS